METSKIMGCGPWTLAFIFWKHLSLYIVNLRSKQIFLLSEGAAGLSGHDSMLLEQNLLSVQCMHITCSQSSNFCFTMFFSNWNLSFL
jgi:hypothetical protein